ncbi:MAG: O-antigen ligase family protein, partial [Planctomycetota bacterium]
EKSVQLRPLLALVAWEMFQDRPLTGHGYGQYFRHSKPYHEVRKYGMPLQTTLPYIQHNVFLGYVVDMGLIGLGSLCGLLIGWTAIAIGLLRDAPVRGPAGGRSAMPHRANSADQPTRGEQRQLAIVVLCLISAYAINGMFHDVSLIDMIHMTLFFLGGLIVSLHQQRQRGDTVLPALQ